HVLLMLQNRKRYVNAAFDLLKDSDQSLSFIRWCGFYEAYSILQKNDMDFGFLSSPEAFDALDTLQRGILYREDFLRILEMYSYTNALKSSGLDRFNPQRFSSLFTRFLHALPIDSCIDGVVAFALGLTFLQTMEVEYRWMGGFSLSFSSSLCTFQTFLSIAYIVGVFLKIMKSGFHSFWNDSFCHNRFDSILTLCLIVLEISQYTYGFPTSRPLENWSSRCLFFVKVYSGIRLGFRIHPFQRLISSLFSVLKAFYTVLGLLLIIFYVYASLGTQIFGGLVECTKSPENSSWSLCDCCVLNFNSFLSSLITLFILMVNGWDSSLEILADHVHSFWCALYFISFYFFTDTIVLNLFVALILEAYEQVNPSKLRDSDEPAESGFLQPPVDSEKVLLKMFQSEYKEV
ncbi:transporter, cation channel family protein, partial [Cardiosporidium cionae]